MNKNPFVVFLLVFVFFFSCAQEKKPTNEIKNLVEKLQNFEKEPNHNLRVTSNLAYEVRVNGLPAAYGDKKTHPSRLMLINNCIPKSGNQILEIFIYTPKNEIQFSDDSSPFELKINKDYWEKSGGLSEPTEILEFALSEKDVKENEDVFYKKLNFKAEVPYKMYDWENATVLNPTDSAAIKLKLLEKYNSLKENYETKNGELYVNTLNKGLFSLLQGAYFTKEESNDYINKKIEFINKENRKLAEFENYKIVFSGDNKLVSLRRTDDYNMNEGILRRYYNKGKQKLVYVDDVIFYQPKDKNDFEPIYYLNLEKGANP